MERAVSPCILWGPETQPVGLGWYGDGPLARKNASSHGGSGFRNCACDQVRQVFRCEVRSIRPGDCASLKPYGCEDVRIFESPENWTIQFRREVNLPGSAVVELQVKPVPPRYRADVILRIFIWLLKWMSWLVHFYF